MAPDDFLFNCAKKTALAEWRRACRLKTPYHQPPLRVGRISRHQSRVAPGPGILFFPLPTPPRSTTRERDSSCIFCFLSRPPAQSRQRPHRHRPQRVHLSRAQVPLNRVPRSAPDRFHKQIPRGPQQIDHQGFWKRVNVFGTIVAPRIDFADNLSCEAFCSQLNKLYEKRRSVLQGPRHSVIFRQFSPGPSAGR